MLHVLWDLDRADFDLGELRSLSLCLATARWPVESLAPQPVRSPVREQRAGPAERRCLALEAALGVE